jgi:hypothetical protein
VGLFTRGCFQQGGELDSVAGESTASGSESSNQSAARRRLRSMADGEGIEIEVRPMVDGERRRLMTSLLLGENDK